METFGDQKPVFLLRDLASAAIATGDCTPVAIHSRRLEFGKISCFVHGSSVSTVSLASGALASFANFGGAFTGNKETTYRIRMVKLGNPDIFEVLKDNASLSTYNVITKAAQAIDQGITMTFATQDGFTIGGADANNWKLIARPNMRSTVHIQVTMDTQVDVDAGTALFITPSDAKKSSQGLVELDGVYSHIRASVATLTPTDLFAGASAGTLNPASFVDVLL